MANTITMRKLLFAAPLSAAFRIFVFTLFAVLFNALQLRAQPPLYHCPQPGMMQSEVYIQDWTQNFQPLNYPVVYTSDTVIGNITFSKVGPYYTYYDSGRVYFSYSNVISNTSGFQLLYDFSLNVGDTCPLFATNCWNVYGNYIVDSVSTLLLPNGQTRKYMELTNGNNRLKWLDAVGDIERGFYYYCDFEGGHHVFVCHSDSSGNVYGAPNSPYYCSMTNSLPTSGNNTCSGFSYTTNVTGANCLGANGSIQLSGITGGTAPYSYQWSNTMSGPLITGLAIGSYTVTISDAAGMTCSQAYFVGSNVPSVAINVLNTTTCDYQDTLCAVVSGGTPPYFYSWAPAGYMLSCMPVTSFISGTFTVSVTDANGCSAFSTVAMQAITPVTVNAVAIPASCGNCCDGNALINPAGGTPPYVISYPNGPWPQAGNFCPGVYSYCITDSIGCVYCDSVQVSFSTGVQSGSAENEVRIYPVPASADLQISATTVIGEVRIFDMNNKLLETITVNSNAGKIDVSALSNGIYFLEIHGKRQRLAVIN